MTDAQGPPHPTFLDTGSGLLVGKAARGHLCVEILFERARMDIP